MLAKYLCLLVVVVVVVNSAPSAKSDRKCLPMQWEAFVFGKLAQVNKGEGQVYEFIGMSSTDYSKKISVFQETVYDGGNFVGNYTFLMNEKQTYFIDNIKMTCSKLPGAKQEHLCSDSSSLTYLGSWSIGGMMTDTYDVMLKDRKSTITVLRDSFTVVSQVMEQKFIGLPQMAVLQFGNVTNGIADPSVFDIPSYC